MAGTLSADVTVAAQYQAVTVTGTGFSTDTEYRIAVTRSGGQVAYIDIISDGSGDFSFPIDTNSGDGSFTVEARPITEYQGTTTAEDSTTFTVA